MADVSRSDELVAGDHPGAATERAVAISGWGRWLELPALGVLFGLYQLVIHLLPPRWVTAQVHAAQLWAAERHLHLAVELDLNRWVSAHTVFAVASGVWYSLFHWAVTPAALIWAKLRASRQDFVVARDTLIAANVVALVGYVSFPTAPPRLVPHAGFVDTLIAYASYGWWDNDSALSSSGELANQLAAMPSMHVGWAVWVALVTLTMVRRWWWRVAAVTYPCVTAVDVVATANHWLLDVVVGAAVVLLCWWGRRALSRRAKGRNRLVYAYQPAWSTPPGMSASGWYGTRVNRNDATSRYAVPSRVCRTSSGSPAK